MSSKLQNWWCDFRWSAVPFVDSWLLYVRRGGARGVPGGATAPPKFSAWRHATALESYTDHWQLPLLQNWPLQWPPQWKCLAPPLYVRYMSDWNRVWILTLSVLDFEIKVLDHIWIRKTESVHLCRLPREHGRQKDFFQGGGSRGFSQIFFQGRKSGEIWLLPLQIEKKLFC